MMMMTMMMWENSFLLQILGWGVSEAKNRERREWDFG